VILLSLFFTFFKIGLFGFGGGYGMLSLIQMETVVKHEWLSSAEFTNIVAISQMTPGPIGINTATYCGYSTAHHAGFGNLMSILASATSTIALILPSFILMILISKLFMKYFKTPAIQNIFKGLHPAVVGLLGGATLLLCNTENFSSPVINPWHFFISIALFASTFYATMWLKINPIRMICYAAFAGLLLLY
jgi:CHR family chromate ion efflux pump